MSCGCDACKDPYKLPLGPPGEKGDPGQKGDDGRDGSCLAATSGIIYSSHGIQSSPSGLVSNFEFSNFTNSIPAGTLNKDGDTIIIRSNLSKEGVSGAVTFGIYFASTLVQYDFSTLSSGFGVDPFVANAEIKITRLSSSSFVAISMIHLFGGYQNASGYVYGAGTDSKGFNPGYYNRVVSTTPIDLDTTSYDIKVLVDGDLAAGNIKLESMIIELIDTI